MEKAVINCIKLEIHKRNHYGILENKYNDGSTRIERIKDKLIKRGFSPFPLHTGCVFNGWLMTRCK